MSDKLLELAAAAASGPRLTRCASSREVIDCARALRLARSGEARARALAALFEVVDRYDGAPSSTVVGD